MNKEEIKAMIEKYGIFDGRDGTIRVPQTEAAKRALPQIKSAKPEILAYFAECRQMEEMEAARRKANFESIPGVAILEAAYEEWYQYREAFQRAMDRGDSCFPAKPKENIDDLREQYPDGVFAITVKGKCSASNDEIASIAKKAYEALQEGEPVDAVRIQYDSEMDAFTERHIWD